MATTTNFGWETPDDTDLVKDGAAAIRTTAGAIDTSLADLKGGTTGQALVKNSNTDMDFVWSAIDPLQVIDAKGDLIVGAAADTPARLAVGSDGQALVADSTATNGVKWASPSGASKSYSLLNTGGTAMSGSNTVTISGISGMDDLIVLVVNANSSNYYFDCYVKFNGTSSTNLFAGSRYQVGGGTAGPGSMHDYSGTGDIYFGTPYGDNPYGYSGSASISGCNSSGYKRFASIGGNSSGSAYKDSLWAQGIIGLSAAITSVSVYGSQTFNSGTVYVYGAA